MGFVKVAHRTPEEAFQVTQSDQRIIRTRKRELKRRLNHLHDRYREKPMNTVSNVRYEMSGRIRALDCGGVGAMAVMAKRLGLVDAIDERLRLLKVHLPYHESDHVMNFALNILGGGQCMEDMELRRTNESYLDALGAKRTPDPTTAGDFTRRFKSSEQVMVLQEAINGVRLRVWESGLSKAERAQAILDMDGTIAETTGECKQGMDISYHGVWGYAPLIISLANTGEPLYLVNRPGNKTSADGAAPFVDRAIHLVLQKFRSVLLRGDTDFSQTSHLDRWDAEGVKFVFGIDAMPNLVQMAEAREETAWKPLKRRIKHLVETAPRRRPEHVKERIIKARGFKNKRLLSEHVTEFLYQPTKCAQPYRLVVLRKNISVEKGESTLFPEIRYFFYITNLWKGSPKGIVFLANDRCNQENLIDQLKNGLHALRMPVGDLVSNWAYMVMAALAWTLKAWWAMQIQHPPRKREVLKMEFRPFVEWIMRIPCQILKTARQTVYRILGYNAWTETFLKTFDRIRRLRPVRC